MVATLRYQAQQLRFFVFFFKHSSINIVWKQGLLEAIQMARGHIFFLFLFSLTLFVYCIFHCRSEQLSPAWPEAAASRPRSSKPVACS